jgi:hypothetical protein
MKVGQVYKYQNTYTVIPLSEPDIDGKALYVIFLRINEKINNVNQSVISTATGVNNTAKAVQIFDNPNFKFEVIYQQILEKDLQSTYVNSSELALAVGDRYQYVGKSAEYTVLCFFMRIKNPKTQIFVPYPFGVKLADVISFVNGVVNTKQGIEQYLTGPAQGLTNDFQNRVKAIFFGTNDANSELAYWTIADPKLPKVIYIKQPKPKKKIELSPVRVPQIQSTSSVYINAMPKVIDDTDEAVKNFNAVEIDIRSRSLLLDRFRYVVVNNSVWDDENAMRLFGGNAELTLVYVGKLIDENKPTTGIVMGMNLLTNSYGQFFNVRKSSSVHVYDIDKYVELINGNTDGTIRAVDYTNTVRLDSQLNTPVVLNSAMMYFGAGNFIDVEKGMGRYGVGDEFHITPQDQSGMNIDFVILYSFQVKNKKTELEIGYRCIKKDFLQVAGDTVNFSGDASSHQIYYIDILQSQLDEKLESGLYDNFVSHRETRLKIYEAYTQEVTTAPKGPAVDTFATFKEILGDQYDDDFLAVVAALDWQKINALRQKDPTTLDAIKQLIEQIYVDYLIEKDFTPTSKKNSTNAGEVNSAAFVYPIDDVSKENIIKRLEHINKAYLDREIFPLQLNDEPFPKMNLAEFGELFMDVIGEKTLPQPLIWNQDRASVNLYINKSVEPAVNLSMYFARYSGDGDVKLEFKGIHDFGYARAKGIEYRGSPERIWGYVNNYPQKYYAAYVMYWLSVYTLPADMGHVLFTSETKSKQVLPLKASQFALNELRYFNSLGLFPTPEMAVDYIKEIASDNDLTNINTDYFGNGFRFIGNWFYSNTTSKVSGYTKFGNIRIKTDQVKLYMFQNDARLFIKQLKDIDVDWGNPNAVYEPVVTTTTTTPPIKRVRKPKKPKVKFDMWKEYPKHINDEIDAALGKTPNQFQGYHSYFEYEGQRYVYTMIVTTNPTVMGVQSEDATMLFASCLEPVVLIKSDAIMSEFYSDFIAQDAKLKEQNPNIEDFYSFVAPLIPTGQEFIKELRRLLEEMKNSKTVVTPQVPKDFGVWIKSASYIIDSDALSFQLRMAYGTDGIDLYNTIFSYKNDNYFYFSLLYQPRLVSNVTQVNAAKDLQAYAMIMGYSQLSTSFTTDYEQIFTDELTKGANSLNRNVRTLGVVIPKGEENSFIDGYYLYVKDKANQQITPPAPPTPPPTPPTPPPAPPKPPKPKVKKVVTPTPVKQTKVEKLSQKYDDLDIDF